MFPSESLLIFVRHSLPNCCSVRTAGYFLTKIFHPNVAPSGDICVNTLKRDWKADTTLSHVLQVIRCLLIVPFPESSLNDEAGKLFMESYDEYARKAKLWTSIHAANAGGLGAATPSSSSSAAPFSLGAAPGPAHVAAAGSETALSARSSTGYCTEVPVPTATCDEPLRSNSTNAAQAMPSDKRKLVAAADRPELKKKLAKRL